MCGERRGGGNRSWASLAAYAAASGALAWGSAAGWDGRAFRVYYLFGGLLTAPLLGVGSLLRAGHRWASVAGLAVAAAGSALVGLGEAGTAAVFAAAVLLLYLGFSAPAGWRVSPSSSSKSDR